MFQMSFASTPPTGDVEHTACTRTPNARSRDGAVATRPERIPQETWGAPRPYGRYGMNDRREPWLLRLTPDMGACWSNTRRADGCDVGHGSVNRRHAPARPVDATHTGHHAADSRLACMHDEQGRVELETPIWRHEREASCVAGDRHPVDQIRAATQGWRRDLEAVQVTRASVCSRVIPPNPSGPGRRVHQAPRAAVTCACARPTFPARWSTHAPRSEGHDTRRCRHRARATIRCSTDRAGRDVWQLHVMARSVARHSPSSRRDDVGG